MTTAMAFDVQSLTAIQAQRAVMIVYDMLPQEAWTSGSKASQSSLEVMVDNLLDVAKPGLAEQVQALIGEGHDELKGALAQQALLTIAGDATLAPIVSDAMARARQPNMTSLPLVVGACIMALCILPKWERVEKDGQRTTKLVFDPAGRAALLLEKLADLLKALPAGFRGGS